MGWGEGEHSLSDLNRDGWPDRVRLSEGFVLNGVLILSLFALNRLGVYVINANSSVTL